MARMRMLVYRIVHIMLHIAGHMRIRLQSITMHTTVHTAMRAIMHVTVQRLMNNVIIKDIMTHLFSKKCYILSCLVLCSCFIFWILSIHLVIHIIMDMSNHMFMHVLALCEWYRILLCICQRISYLISLRVILVWQIWSCILFMGIIMQSLLRRTIKCVPSMRIAMPSTRRTIVHVMSHNVCIWLQICLCMLCFCIWQCMFNTHMHMTTDSSMHMPISIGTPSSMQPYWTE